MVSAVRRAPSRNGPSRGAPFVLFQVDFSESMYEYLVKKYHGRARQKPEDGNDDGFVKEEVRSSNIFHFVCEPLDNDVDLFYQVGSHQTDCCYIYLASNN
jgi:hypothetical protein